MSFSVVVFFAILMADARASTHIDIDKFGPIEIYQSFNCSHLLGNRFFPKSSSDEEPLEILTPRLVLRRAKDSDWNQISKIYSDPDTLYNLAGEGTYFSNRDLMHLHQRFQSGIQAMSHIRFENETPTVFNIRIWEFVIALRENDLMIGGGSIRRVSEHEWRVGSAILYEYRNQGYSTERLEAVVRFIREIDPRAIIQAAVLKTNLESQRVMQKSRFKREHNPDPGLWTYRLNPE